MLNFLKPNGLLKTEALIGFVLIVTLYWKSDSSWLLFALLFFVPDISMLGYLVSVRIGTIAYNILHMSGFAFLLALIGLLIDNMTCLSIGMIWAAHITFDRMLGFGLKYPKSFNDTHLGMIGKLKQQ